MTGKRNKSKVESPRAISLTFKFLFLASILIFNFSIISSQGFISDSSEVSVITGNLTNLSQMQDTNIPSPTDGYVLTWNDTSGMWEDESAAAVGDTNETDRFEALVNDDCGAGYLVTGVYDNGTVVCAEDQSAAYDDAWINETIYNKTEVDDINTSQTNYNIENNNSIINWANSIFATIADYYTKLQSDAKYYFSSDNETDPKAYNGTLVDYNTLNNGTYTGAYDDSWINETIYNKTEVDDMNTSNNNYIAENNGSVNNYIAENNVSVNNYIASMPTYPGDVWVNESGDSMTGDLNMTGNNISQVLKIFYNVTGCEDDTIEGTTCWNPNDQTLNIVTGLGNVHQVGQEIYGIGFNDAGDTVLDGQVVAIAGAIGDRPTFILADGSVIANSSMVGVVTTDCADSTECPVTTFGYVRGLDTSAWAAGSKLYINADEPGNLTDTMQTLPNNPIWVATVLRSHASTGIIFVFPRFDPTDGFIAANMYATENVTVNGSISMINFSLQRLETNDEINGDLFAVCMTGPTGECLPHFGVQPGGSSQASFLARSLMIVDEAVEVLNNTNRTSCIAWSDYYGTDLKIDCNTTTTGADLYVGDDLQVNGDVYLRDTDGEWHFMTRELELNDELRDNSVTSQVNISLTDNVFTIEESDGDTIAVVIDEVTTFLGTTDTLTITEGTNESPIFNHIYYNGGGTPTLQKSTTEVLDVADVGQVLLGENYTYASIGGSATGSKFIRGVYHRFFDDGALYKSGFNITASSDTLNFSNGTIKIILDDYIITQNHTTTDLAIEIHSDGTFHQHINDLDAFDSYSDGGAVGNNRYFNMVCGVAVTHDNVGRLYCIPQNEPSTEHTSVTEAEQDSTYVLYFPSNDFIKKLFIPVAGIVVQRSGGTNTIQTRSNGFLFTDLRGRISGAGSPPVATIDTNTNIIDDNLYNTTELEEQADNRLGIVNSWLQTFVENVITAFVDSAFVEALGFYTEAESDAKYYFDPDNETDPLAYNGTLVDYDTLNNGTYTETYDDSWINETSDAKYYFSSDNETDPLAYNGTLVDYNTLNNGTYTASAVEDVWVNTTGDTMTGDLNISDANLYISQDSFICISQDCLSNISYNGTHTIWW